MSIASFFRRKPKLSELEQFIKTHPTPTFQDFFAWGSLDQVRWSPSNWSAPGGGTFSPLNVSLSSGCLALKLQQKTLFGGDIGGEISGKFQCGYGLYEYVARMGSTSPTPDALGVSVSGGVCGLFNYVDDSATEIDFEVQGQSPTMLEMTTWSGVAYHYSVKKELLGLADGFHKYQFLWLPGRVTFYLDEVLIGTITKNVPTRPAFILLNHWGTNNPNFGGWETLDIDRYLYVKAVKYTAE